MALILPFLPKSRGNKRVDDLWVLSGIIHVLMTVRNLSHSILHTLHRVLGEKRKLVLTVNTAISRLLEF